MKEGEKKRKEGEEREKFEKYREKIKKKKRLQLSKNKTWLVSQKINISKKLFSPKKDRFIFSLIYKLSCCVIF